MTKVRNELWTLSFCLALILADIALTMRLTSNGFVEGNSVIAVLGGAWWPVKVAVEMVLVAWMAARGARWWQWLAVAVILVIPVLWNGLVGVLHG